MINLSSKVAAHQTVGTCIVSFKETLDYLGLALHFRSFMRIDGRDSEAKYKGTTPRISRVRLLIVPIQR
jgi:hypothetical protein